MFIKDTRDNGEQFYRLTDDAPAWLRQAVQNAHHDDFPNDWIYEECAVAYDACEDHTLADEDDLHDYADSRVDVYTKDLYQWQADMCLTNTFSMAENTAQDCGSTMAPATIQYFAIENIARAILDAYRSNH
jgi:hypothetical protein